MPELEKETEMAMAEEAEGVNRDRGESEDGEIAKSTEAMRFQNLTVVEVMQSRSVGSIVQALSKVYAKFKSLGVQIFRLHAIVRNHFGQSAALVSNSKPPTNHDRRR